MMRQVLYPHKRSPKNQKIVLFLSSEIYRIVNRNQQLSLAQPPGVAANGGPFSAPASVTASATVVLPEGNGEVADARRMKRSRKCCSS